MEGNYPSIATRTFEKDSSRFCVRVWGFRSLCEFYYASGPKGKVPWTPKRLTPWGRGTGPATGNTQPHISLQTDAKSRSLDSLESEELSREPEVTLRELQCDLQGQGAAGLAGPQHESGTRVLSWGSIQAPFRKGEFQPAFVAENHSQRLLQGRSPKPFAQTQREHSSKWQTLEKFNVPDFWEFTSHHM